MKQILITLIFLLSLAARPALAEKLVKIWQLDGLSNPESVIYDSRNGLLYVSNVNGAPNEKDGNGFISRVSLDGKMLDQQWVGGLDAPKGLTIHHDRLYVSDIDTLVEIDIGSGSIVNTWSDPDAKFLNDVTADRDGRIYVSDMVTNRIHVLEDGHFSVWLEDAALENPNGLHAESLQLIVGAWGVMTDGFATEIPGHLKAVSLHDKSIRSLGTGVAVGNLDGVEPVDDEFYVTDWIAGRLFRIDRYGNARLLLELEQGMADHEYIGLHRLILLPMMKNNTLLAYKVN